MEVSAAHFVRLVESRSAVRTALDGGR